MREIRRRNSGPCIPYGERNIVRMTPEPDVDAPAARRVLDRVRHEVEEQLPQSRPISCDRDICSEREVHRHAGALAQYHGSFIHFLRELAKIDSLAIQIEPPLI